MNASVLSLLCICSLRTECALSLLSIGVSLYLFCICICGHICGHKSCALIEQ